jgi:hypothetical protein
MAGKVKPCEAMEKIQSKGDREWLQKMQVQ